MKAEKQISFKIALTKAQNLCATHEKCISDIRKKLFDWKLPESEHEKAIHSLQDDKFIDEERFAVYYTKDKFRYNKWGKIKIDYSLKQKNISSRNIKNALDQISDTEYDNLLETELMKKLKTLKEGDEYTIKSKLVRFAASRGFENGKVFDIVSSILKNHKRDTNY